MYLSFFDEKPFFDELDFSSKYVKEYLYSLYSPNRDSNNPDFQSIHNLQNIIIHGPRASGKTTQIYSFLASLFNTRSIYHISNQIYENNFHYKSSQYHMEISTKYFKNSDIMDDSGRSKNVDFIRNVIQTPNMSFNVPKILYIRHFDYCSPEIQKFFLRIIEKSMKDVRFILEIHQLSNVSEAIQSRFLCLPTYVPKIDELQYALQNTYSKFVSEKNDHFMKSVIDHAILYSNVMNFTYKPTSLHYNLKHAFGIMSVYISSLDKTFYIPTYIKKLIKIKNTILTTNQDNFFDHMLIIRELLLELFVNNIQSEVVQKYLYITFTEYFQDKNEDIQKEITDFYVKIDYNTNVSNKDVLFSEYFVIFILKKILFTSQNQINKKIEVKEEVVKIKEEEVKEVKEVKEEVEIVKKKRVYKKKEKV